jgi:hypothetical protein
MMPSVRIDWDRIEEGTTNGVLRCGWCDRPMAYLFGPDCHWCAHCWNAVGNEEVWEAERVA